jgi:hypothetical protein
MSFLKIFGLTAAYVYNVSFPIKTEVKLSPRAFIKLKITRILELVCHPVGNYISLLPYVMGETLSVLGSLENVNLHTEQ